MPCYQASGLGTGSMSVLCLHPWSVLCKPLLHAYGFLGACVIKSRVLTAAGARQRWRSRAGSSAAAGARCTRSVPHGAGMRWPCCSPWLRCRCAVILRQLTCNVQCHRASHSSGGGHLLCSPVSIRHCSRVLVTGACRTDALCHSVIRTEAFHSSSPRLQEALELLRDALSHMSKFRAAAGLLPWRGAGRPVSPQYQYAVRS